MGTFDHLDVIVRNKDGRYTAWIPELRLYATADDRMAALASLDQKREALVAELIEAGTLEDFVAQYVQLTPRARAGGRFDHVREDDSLLAQLLPFALKSAILVSLLTAAMAFATVILTDRLQAVTRDLADRTQTIVRPVLMGGREFWSKVEHQLDANADPKNDIPEAKKQKLLKDIRVMVDRARPFVHEVMRVFDPPAPSAARPN